VLLLLAAGCSSPKDPPAPEVLVGPAPLRRLSDSEYLNALHDLFPALHPLLPTLPTDTAIAGFENAAAVQQPSDVRIARYETIANLYAAEATVDTPGLVGCTWATDEAADACATQFLGQIGSRVFRRPLTWAERDRFLQRFTIWRAELDFPAAVRLTLSLMLQSPQFLYRPEPTQPDGPLEAYAMASRLSFFLWESVPDDALLAAAAADALKSPEQLRSQAQRMLGDPRARRLLWNFHRQWLGLDRILGDEHRVRSAGVDPGWTRATAVSALEESQRFVESVLLEQGSFGELFTSRRAWVNAEMARVYGVPAPISDWKEVLLPAAERAGLLTRTAFLASTSHPGATSPPLRGNALRLRVLCQLASSPPPDADLSMPQAAPDGGPQTNRMLFEQRTQPASCQGCHLGLNGLGFGFENYNAAGGWQTQEHGLAIDARGGIWGTDVDREFSNALELSQALSHSEVVHRCATLQWVRYALGRAPVDLELPAIDALGAHFLKSGGNVHSLLLELVTLPSFRLRVAEED
jgi:hypothetical protein